jgi:hypothetical protein
LAEVISAEFGTFLGHVSGFISKAVAVATGCPAATTGN